jgi:signal transduction histidine kinase/ActR/RegA family two-component response regulator
MNWGSEKKITIWYLIFLVFLSGNFLVSFRSIGILLNYNDSVEESYKVVTELHEILSAVTGAETAQRGYLITADESYLQSYDSAAPHIKELLDETGRLVGDNASQQTRIQNLNARIAEKFGEMTRAIELRRSGNEYFARQLVLTGEGQRLMDEIRSTVIEMDGDEFDLLRRRSDDANRARTNLYLTFAVSTFVGIFLLVAFYYFIRRDLLERGRIGKEREMLLAQEQKARGQAEAANRLKDEFLATVSHELRTPLNAILGWARILSGGKLDRERSLRAVEVIERNAKAQAELIEDLLNVSRIISGKMTLEIQTVDLGALLESSIDVVRPAAAAKNIRLSLETAGGEAPLEGDPARLQQVIWNLLSNAVKFTPQGGEISVSLAYTDSSAVVMVRDSGQGIDAESLPFVFDRFKQADSAITRNYGGLGLGLSIARYLVDMHGGTITAQSDGPGKGTVFTLTLPLRTKPPAESLRAEAVTDRPVEHAKVDSDEFDSDLKDLHVLVVEDQEDSREMLRILLSLNGAEVWTASSAPEALEKFRERIPDLLISDIGMPGEDGYAMMRKIRALPAAGGGGVSSIALTGYAAASDEERAQDSGFDRFIAKPFEPAKLLELIKEIRNNGKYGGE